MECKHISSLQNSKFQTKFKVDEPSSVQWMRTANDTNYSMKNSTFICRYFGHRLILYTYKMLNELIFWMFVWSSSWCHEPWTSNIERIFVYPKMLLAEWQTNFGTGVNGNNDNSNVDDDTATPKGSSIGNGMFRSPIPRSINRLKVVQVFCIKFSFNFPKRCFLFPIDTHSA